MAGQARLGVPENGRVTTARQASTAFDTYSRLLLSYCDEFDAAELSVSSLERFETRVREIAAALASESGFLLARSGLQVAGATTSAARFDIHEVVDDLVATQRLAYGLDEAKEPS